MSKSPPHSVEYRALEELLVKTIMSKRAWEQYHQGSIAHEEFEPFLAEIKRISNAYTLHEGGTALRAPVVSSRAAEAYALYYTAINSAKVISLLKNMSIPLECSVLDFGCGPGTGALALLAGTTSRLTIQGVEPQAAMREVAGKLFAHWGDPGRIKKVTLARDLTSVTGSSAPSRYDVVIAANVLAEMPLSDGRADAERLAELVADSGYLVLVEPGQQRHTRNLMQLRDELLRAQPEMTPIFPCCTAQPCPMLRESPSDWCHGTLSWDRPPVIQTLDKLLGFNKHRLKFSAFIFQRKGRLRSGYRVVIPPERVAQGVVAGLCGSDYYGQVIVKKGARSETNRALEKSDVFEHLEVSPALVGEPPLQLSKDTQVTRRR